MLEAATAAQRIAATYVSTDCPEIAAVVRGLNFGVEIIERPAQFATDEASINKGSNKYKYKQIQIRGQVRFFLLYSGHAPPPRLHLADYPHHIVQRGHNRAACFFAEEDYQTGNGVRS